MRSWRLTSQCAGVLAGVLLVGTTAGTAAARAEAAQGRGLAGPASSLSVPGELTGVAAVSARVAWTVGYNVDAGGDSTPVIGAWNGTRWRQVPVPGVKFAFLTGVAGTSARDAWAVGTRDMGGGPPVIVHWNGHGWKRVPSHSPGTVSQLFAVAAASARSAWAVGQTSGDGPLILRWNGRVWNWAVGGTRSKTLVIRWNGTAWK